MSAKRPQNKRTTGHKKIISNITKAEHAEALATTAHKKNEDAIVKQFHRIQRGYSILMNEVVKEYDLIKNWIEKEATDRTEEIKQKLAAKIPRM